MPTGSPCDGCGRCCRAVSLDYSKRDLVAIAAREKARLDRDPHSPQRADIERLVRDVRFVQRWFRRLSRAEAITRQPALASSEYDGRAFYRCLALDADGRCTRHAERPFLCEGYPWYGSAPSSRLLVVRPCGYEREVTDAVSSALAR